MEHVCAMQDRPTVYRALLGVLSCEDDAALQLAAIVTLHTLVDDWSVTTCSPSLGMALD